MRKSFYADLHIHSKYSRATSKDCDLEHLTYWGRKKGITVIGTGDFTHPAWIAEIKEKLIPAEPGLFRLRGDIEKKVLEKVPASCRGVTRFMLSVEISTIYKKGDKTRKVHHLVYAPTIEKAEKINRKLESIGNIRSDGRPILGLDSRHLLEIVLEAGEDCYLVPAHIWTPWFAVLGSKSGFDSVAECYADLAHHIFAVETGLSSDPEMNWRVSGLDRYRLVSNSDAHSPPKLGREACVFETELDFYAMRRALESGKGYGGSVEFFPEEGKYHLDGHRKCEVRLHPEESKKYHGLCPECQKPLTLGVMYRVDELADRKEGSKPEGASDFKSFIPLPEMVSEIAETGVASQKVEREYEALVSKLGPELEILSERPLEDIQRAGSSILAEAISRMRQGKVIREAGYDGEYGVIRLFKKGELENKNSVGVLFEMEEEGMRRGEKREEGSRREIPSSAPLNPSYTLSTPLLHSQLDPEQQKAVDTVNGPLLIIAGPGSGKTRTLTHRIANLIQDHGASPEACLAVTFTRRAAREMEERLKRLVPGKAEKIPVLTFHSLGLKIIQENREALGLPGNFKIVKDKESVQDQNSLSYEDLIRLPVELLEKNSGLCGRYQERWRWISIDEYQDIDELQYRLIHLLVGREKNICAIGDPDQAIYSFRGADVGHFLRFEQDFLAGQTICLKHNYRSGESILSASAQVISKSSLVEDRQVRALIEDTGKVVIHHARSDKAEAEFMVQTIEQMIGGTTFFSMDSGRSEGRHDREYSFSDFAVLYRMDAQSQALVEALARSGIPYQKRSHQPLMEDPDVRKFLENSGTHRDMPLGEAILAVAAQAGIQNPAAIEKLCLIAGRVKGDWDQFFLEVSLEQDVDTWDPRADRVSLLTLHAAKGLEFPVVFIAGCEDGILPVRWGGESNEPALAEERRLFYVGMTRAQDRLILSHAAKRFWRGKMREQEISPFLKDIEERLLEQSRSLFKKRKPLNVQMDLF